MSGVREEIEFMADQQPGDGTTVAGTPDPTRAAGAGAGEPPTADLPGRWSGAAAIPDRGGIRRSRWSRFKDRLAGTGGQGTEIDDRTTVPAVDPWADQDTPAWPDAYTTPAADPTLFDGPAERTLFQTSPAPADRSPASADRTLFETAPAADRTLFETSPAADRTLFEASPAAPPAAGPSSRAADAAPQRPSLLERVRQETDRLRKEAAAAAREPVNPQPAPAAGGPVPAAPTPVGPAPGTYPPPAGGTGLPPRVRPKWQVWGERAAASSRQAAAEAPDRLRSWRQQAGTWGQQQAESLRQPAGSPDQAGYREQGAGSLGRPAGPVGRPAGPVRQQADDKGRQAAAGTPGRLRLWKRKPVPESAVPPRIPVQPRPAARPWAPTPARPKRRFRRLRRLTLVVAVVIALFTVGPYVQPHIPVLNQFPVTAILPDDFSDLSLRDTEAGRQAAQKLADQLQEAGSGSDTFAGIYGDGRGKRVTVFGVTGLRLTPGSDVADQLGRMADSLSLKNIQPIDTGVFGVHQQCGTGRLDGTSVVACAWADHGSLATVLLTRRSLDESATLVSRLRSTVLTTTSPLV
ncbi:MAG TPA: hypothetical protein VN408_43490 [Actinoplanes sp.]|nr:hypothetical protein [Actinoplanes sp.]